MSALADCTFGTDANPPQTVKTPAFIIQALLEDIHSHIGQGNQSDDLTLLAIKYKGIPGSK